MSEHLGTPNENELVPGSFADTGGTVSVAWWSLSLQAACCLIYVVLVLLAGHNIPGADLLAYSVPFLGFIASVSGVLAAMILRHFKWLLVPVFAAFVFAAQLIFVLKCCVRWGS